MHQECIGIGNADYLLHEFPAAQDREEGLLAGNGPAGERPGIQGRKMADSAIALLQVLFKGRKALNQELLLDLIGPETQEEIPGVFFGPFFQGRAAGHDIGEAAAPAGKLFCNQLGMGVHAVDASS